MSVSPWADPPDGELEGVAEGADAADGVMSCGVEAPLEEALEADGFGEAVGLLQPAVSTHKARAAHTARSIICFFMKQTSINK
ncbi:MAG: hypothetical protein ACXV3U_03250 [Halobacteriota archaeon]